MEYIGIHTNLINISSCFQQGRVRQKVSSRGKYVSVNIGPVQVVSSEQVSFSLSLKYAHMLTFKLEINEILLPLYNLLNPHGADKE